MTAPYDVLVIGAGFGGLGTALALAESGARVCLCESLRYPGGCASTFTRKLPGPDGVRVAHSFEAGATVVSGLGKDQLFGRWLSRYAPEVVVEFMDPLVELRAPNVALSVGQDRSALVEQLCALPDAPAQGITAFFEEQKQVADVLWEFFDDPTHLPPFDVSMLLRHAGRSLRYAKLLPLLGRPLASVLKRHGVADFAPLRLYLDALCQITVQCSAAEAEAPFALAAMDYYFRGTGHVKGGFGALAWALLRACQKLGADVRLSRRVEKVSRTDGLFSVTLRGGEVVQARQLAANLLPDAAHALFGEGEVSMPAHLRTLDRAVMDGWSAAMFYAVAEPSPGMRAEAHHLELVNDPSLPLIEGNHVFVSISGADETERAPAGRRTITMSSHVPLQRVRKEEDVAAYIEGVQAQMKATVRERAPGLFARIEQWMPASPRTFARFVGRADGAVGGVPRRAGLHNYQRIGPTQLSKGFYLVGDSIFPGQSALATAIGGVRTASAMMR